MRNTETVPVLAAVIEREGRFLIYRRPAHKRHGGLWEFPGGKIETGESPLDAARRELAEELHLVATAIEHLLLAVQDAGSPPAHETGGDRFRVDLRRSLTLERVIWLHLIGYRFRGRDRREHLSVR